MLLSASIICVIYAINLGDKLDWGSGLYTW